MKKKSLVNLNKVGGEFHLLLFQSASVALAVATITFAVTATIASAATIFIVAKYVNEELFHDAYSFLILL